MTEGMWTVTVEAAGEPGSVNEDQVLNMATLLEKFDAAISMAQDGAGVAATISVPHEAGTEVGTAFEYAMVAVFDATYASGITDVYVERAEIISNEALDARLAEPALPELVGISEIADILAVSKQRAHQLTRRADFPEPVARLAAGPIWAKPNLYQFIEAWHSDKPDVTDQVAELDAMIADLRRRRNEIMHGRGDYATTSATSTLFAAFTNLLRDIHDDHESEDLDLDPADIVDLERALERIDPRTPEERIASFSIPANLVANIDRAAGARIPPLVAPRDISARH